MHARELAGNMVRHAGSVCCGVLDLHVLVVFVDAWLVIDLSCVLACNCFLV